MSWMRATDYLSNVRYRMHITGTTLQDRWRRGACLPALILSRCVTTQPCGNTLFGAGAMDAPSSGQYAYTTPRAAALPPTLAGVGSGAGSVSAAAERPASQNRWTSKSRKHCTISMIIKVGIVP